LRFMHPCRVNAFSPNYRIKPLNSLKDALA
jgi:hypothetical protein